VRVLSTLWYLLIQELTLAFRQQADVFAVIFFFIVAVSLFPLGVGADPHLLKSIGPGVIWVAALLAAMLSLGRLFNDGYADGTLEQLLLIPVPLPLIVLVKLLSHWLTSCFPLLLMSPLLGLQFSLRPDELGVLMISLLLGTPLLSMIGGVGAALTLGVRGAHVLVAVMVLPLYIPVLIFGSGAVTTSAVGMDPQGALSLLGALLVMGVVFIPYVTSKALYISME